MRTKLLSLVVVVFLASAAQSQYQFKVLHAFTGGSDGGGLWSSVVFDMQGNLYGTTSGGGAYNGGTVFELTPNSNGEWTESVLHSFPSSPDDGAGPFGGVTFDPAGNLYGTTVEGGGGFYYKFGMVYQLSPGLGGWTEAVLYSFGLTSGGAGAPDAGVIDKAGNLYGTAYDVFELSPGPDGWTEAILHNFTDRNGDGDGAGAGVIMDSSGNLYGTTAYGGGRPECPDFNGCGTVYELQPNKAMGIWAPGVKAWKERILHRFPSFVGDGQIPGSGQLAMDSFGNLYGATNQGGGNICVDVGCGMLFKLTLIATSSGGVWVETILHNFSNDANGFTPIGVVFDKAGNMYGTTAWGGSPFCGCGVVYKVARLPGGGWQYTVLHAFVGSDGAQPAANLTIGPDGNLYGTTATGGGGGYGVVFQIQIAQ